MAQQAQNAPILLHTEQEMEQKNPLERLEGEPAQWYFRFRTYALIGPARSLQMVVAQERGLYDVSIVDGMTEAQIGSEIEKIMATSASADKGNVAMFELHDKRQRQALEARQAHVDAMKTLATSVPGSWKRASKTWRWVERAKQYDVQARMDYEQRMFEYLQDTGRYISKAQRLSALDYLVSSMFVQMYEGKFKHLYGKDGQKAFLDWIKVLQGLLKDIRKEMSTIDLTPVRRTE